MAMAYVHNTTINLFKVTLPQPQPKRLFATLPASHFALTRKSISHSVLTLARRRSNAARPASKKNKSCSKVDAGKDDDLGEDAFEALFKQLEEDLKRDEELLCEGDDDVSEEDLALLERELELALGEDEDLSKLSSVTANDSIGDRTDGNKHKIKINDNIHKIETNDNSEVGEEEEADYVENIYDEDYDDEVDDEEEEDEEEEESLKLKGWQLRRLAKALKVGRRKTSIKNLAADLCLNRAVVLKLLRDPPPNLLLLSAALPDKPEPSSVILPDADVTPSVPPSEVTNSQTPEPKEEIPIHVRQESWSARKRLKKVHVNTLESVYRRTKRPTNAMISSIILLTNLPRKIVVKWFEDKRAADGVPEKRRSYQRPPPPPSVFVQ